VNWSIPRFAVIPTTGRACLYDCLEAIQPQVDQVFLIWAPQELGQEIKDPAANLVIEVFGSDEPRNISRWWNVGIDKARYYAREEADAAQWDVVVLNDDAIVAEGWVDRLSFHMRNMKVAAASTGPVNLPVLHTRPGVTPLHQRMAGFAFMLAGEMGVRADETMHWWCGDNDIDMQSRLKGGTVVLPDRVSGMTSVKHLYPDLSTVGEQAARTAIDMARFVVKWGFRPWNL
jgi:hypothetical protein